MGRKRAQVHPPLTRDLPPDHHFYRSCREFVLCEIDPDPIFVRELLRRYIAIARPRPLTGPEVAAVVDYWAARRGSIAKAIEYTHHRLYGEISLESIAQHHKRYGKRSDQLKNERETYWRDWDEGIDEHAKLTDEERKEIADFLNEEDRKWKAYEKAKKDLFG